jgi:Domain of unknown function (DUF4124)
LVVFFIIVPEAAMHERPSSIASTGVRATVRIAAMFVAILAAGPVCAQVYKWVDGSGVTHYSDKAPENNGPASKVKVDVVTDRISVYPQDPNLMRQAASPGNWILADRVDRLERQLQAERQARQYASAADDDYGDYDGYYPYYGVPVVPVRRLRRDFRHVMPVSGRAARIFNSRAAARPARM